MKISSRLLYTNRCTTAFPQTTEGHMKVQITQQRLEPEKLTVESRSTQRVIKCEDDDNDDDDSIAKRHFLRSEFSSAFLQVILL